MSSEFSDDEVAASSVLAHCIWDEMEGRVLIDTELFARLDWREQEKCMRDWVDCLEAVMEDLAVRKIFDDVQKVDMRPTPTLLLVEDDDPPPAA